jgi:hypothetical protein
MFTLKLKKKEKNIVNVERETKKAMYKTEMRKKRNENITCLRIKFKITAVDCTCMLKMKFHPYEIFFDSGK